jgi:hypothetical protein
MNGFVQFGPALVTASHLAPAKMMFSHAGIQGNGDPEITTDVIPGRALTGRTSNGGLCGHPSAEPAALMGACIQHTVRRRQFAASNFAFERARNAAMRIDFQTTRQTLIAKVYPMWCYEECVARRLARPMSSAT